MRREDEEQVVEEQGEGITKQEEKCIKGRSLDQRSMCSPRDTLVGLQKRSD